MKTVITEFYCIPKMYTVYIQIFCYMGSCNTVLFLLPKVVTACGVVHGCIKGIGRNHHFYSIFLLGSHNMDS